MKSEWTSEKPTKPGWYWYRFVNAHGQKDIAQIVEIIQLHSGLKVITYAEEEDLVGNVQIHRFRSGFDTFESTEWSGPLMPPTEAL